MGMKVEYKDKKILIEIDCDPAKFDASPMSGSGKSRTLATTHGNIPVHGAPEAVRIGLNCYVVLPKNEQKPPAKDK